MAPQSHSHLPTHTRASWWCRYVFNESARYRSPTLLLGIPFLLITFIIMLVVTLAILTFRMIGTFGSDFKDDAYFNPTTARALPPPHTPPHTPRGSI